MRHFIDLVEAPLADIEVHGKPLSEPGSFSERDRNYLERNIIQGVYRNRLKALPFNLYIYVLNASALKLLATDYPETEITDDFWEVDLKDFPTVKQAVEINRAKDPTAIHFVIGDNLSDNEQVTVTPWILVHRLMHAWLAAGSTLLAAGSTLGQVAEDTETKLEDMVEELYRLVRVGNSIDRNSLTDKLNKLLYNHFTFGSARNRVVQAGEAIVEMVTQFLFKGKIELKNLDRLTPEYAKQLQKIISTLEREVQHHMRTMTGKAYYI